MRRFRNCSIYSLASKAVLCWFLFQTCFSPLVAADSISASASFRDGQIYLSVFFTDNDESRLESPWVWDESARRYKISAQEEDSFSVVAEPAVPAELCDLWIWRAGRNDPSGRADDCSLPYNVSATLSGLRYDSGTPAWFMVYPSDFAGTILSRFRNREPLGSVADVSVRSSKKDAGWELVFSRALHSVNSDDLDFESGKTYRFYLFRGSPSVFRKSEAHVIPVVIPLSETGAAK